MDLLHGMPLVSWWPSEGSQWSRQEFPSFESSFLGGQPPRHPVARLARTFVCLPGGKPEFGLASYVKLKKRGGEQKTKTNEVRPNWARPGVCGSLLQGRRLKRRKLGSPNTGTFGNLDYLVPGGSSLGPSLEIGLSCPSPSDPQTPSTRFTVTFFPWGFRFTRFLSCAFI